MNILWHNKTCVEISANSKKGGVTIIIDPPGKEEKGRKKMGADVFLFTKKVKPKEKEPFIVNGPGEYEIKEAYIKGFEISPLKTFYSILMEEISICHLGLFEEDELSSIQLEKLGVIDILFLPLEKTEGLDAKKAAKIAGQLEPKIIIPLNCDISEKKILKEFLDIMEVKSPEQAPKLSLKKKTMEEGSKVVILNS